MRCASCASLSSLPIPDAELIERYYVRYYDYRWFRDHAAGKRRDAEERADELAPLLGSRVLDLGGGLGYFTDALRKRGLDAFVYDPYAHHGARRPDAGSFDTVVCLHVLEHAANPLAFLHDAAAFLKPGGRLVIAVPNAAGEGYRRLGTKWVWAQPPLVHIHHFTPGGLLQLLERAGFCEPHLSFHERWDANSVSDITSFGFSRAMNGLWAFPGLKRIGPWRKAVASAAVHLRFWQLEKARRSSALASDRAELLASAATISRTKGHD